MLPSFTYTYSKKDIGWFDERFSRELFVHTYTDKVVLNEFILRLGFQHSIAITEHVKHGLECLLLDLFVRYKTTEGYGTIGVFTSNGPLSSADSRQYEKLGFVGKKLNTLLMKLQASRLVDVHGGIPRHATKVRACTRLITEMDSAGIAMEHISCDLPYPVVYTMTADRQKTRIEIQLELAERAGLNVLQEYNRLLRHAEIWMGHDKPLYAFEKQGRRIFADSEATLNGRFYGPLWQNLPQRARLQLTINGHGVSEIDIKSTHPLIAYALAGYDLTDIRRSEGEAYHLSQLKSIAAPVRDFLKAAVLRMLNCDSLSYATKSMDKELKDNQQYKELIDELAKKNITTRDVLVWLKNRHHKIDKYLFSASGSHLNYFESSIAHRVIEHFTNQGIVVLSVYDSFLIQSRYRDELQRVLVKAISDELGMIFKYPESLYSWKVSDDYYSSVHGCKDLLDVRTHRDRHGLIKTNSALC